MHLLTIIWQELTGLGLWGILFRVVLAALVSGFIGSERGRRGRAAGLRTHVLVCLGSTLAAMTGLYLSTHLGLGGDPARISAQVISGIGFLGAGTILTRNHSHVTGLTTAAGLWTTAAIGLAIGFGFYAAVLAAFAAVILTNTLFPRIERSRKRKREVEGEGAYYLELTNIRRVNEFFEQMNTTLSEMRIVPPQSGTASHVGITCRLDSSSAEDVLLRIRALEYVVIAVPMD